ncbi:SpaA isopeptide-forming pilin-related protein [Bifidobacterium thermacidophilum]|uniref:SpaA isopeptide-forming pilin-related protein n=1 Tax=Bifidobacterium thermacidophilum TaxID=246618 RepID=A0ABW8KTH3_9BIFI
MRKTTNRFAAAILAVATLAASAVMATAPAGAAEAATAFPTAEITVHGAQQGDTFAAWRLLNSTDDGTNYSYTLRTQRDSSTSGIAITAQDTAVTEALTSATGKSTAQNIYDLLNGMTSDSIDLEKQMKTIYQAIKAKTITQDETATANKDDTQHTGAYQATFTDMPQGYYLIAQTNGSKAAGSTVSLLIANTANSSKDAAGNSGVDVNVKADTVQLLSATDQHQAAAQYQDDVAVGTDFTWSATGTLPANYALYDSYKYVFTVKLPTGVAADSEKSDCPVVNASAVNDGTETPIAPGAFTIAKLTEGTCTYSFDNLKTAQASDAASSLTIAAGTGIRLSMKAHLTSDATVGSAGNIISSSVKYSSNPLDSAMTGTTAESTATLYTYKLTVNNTDNSGKALANGAKYSLYSCGYNGCNTQVGAETEASGDYASAVFSGLDSGAYELRETGVPAGYSGADPVKFTVTSDFNNGTVTLTSDNDRVTTTDASMVINMTNTTSGGLLPSTGGAGVVIMYVCGALLVGASLAGIIVAVRRRNRD